MKQKKAGLRSDRDTNLISEFQAATTFETLFCQKHADMAEKFSLVAGGKPTKERNIALNRHDPLSRKRLRLQSAPAPLLQQSENHARIYRSTAGMPVQNKKLRLSGRQRLVALKNIGFRRELCRFAAEY